MTMVEERRAQLEARLAELAERMERIQAERAEVTDPDLAGPVDEPPGDEVQADLAEAAIHETRVIRAALDRIRQGTYGTCSRCGDPISEERLDILPATTLCRDCASA